MTVYVDDGDFRLLHGDALEALATLPDGSVDCCVTSPPYWGLRDYGTGSWDGGDPDCDHRLRTSLTAEKQMASSTLVGSKDTQAHQKEGYKDRCGRCGATRVDRQLGLEPTPDLYVQQMVNVFREVRRVLKDTGTLWLNLGDSYASAWACDRRNVVGAGSLENGKRDNRPDRLVGGLKEKDLVGIPWRVAFALQADGWYLRSDIIWAKPNPMPESVTDRPTKAHEYVFLLSKSPRYFFDQEAVREPHALVTLADHRLGATGTGRPRYDINGEAAAPSGFTGAHPAGRNVRSVWDIATQPYPEAHFATFPEELVRRCILAGTSERGVCPVCGKPWERELERQNESAYARIKREHGITYQDMKAEAEANGITPGNVGGTHAPGQRGANLPPTQNLTLGWRPSCDCHGDRLACSSPVPATVLDPFGGSGTTALVARKHGRHSILIELSEDYCELAARRLSQLSLLTGAV